jgi:hypothetical protein
MDEALWDGEDGTVAQIRRMYREPAGSSGSIRQVLEDVRECVLEHREYSGKRDVLARVNAKLALDGPEATIIADVLEEGQSLRDALACNQYLNTCRLLTWKGLDPFRLGILSQRIAGEYTPCFHRSTTSFQLLLAPATSLLANRHLFLHTIRDKAQPRHDISCHFTGSVCKIVGGYVDRHRLWYCTF